MFEMLGFKTPTETSSGGYLPGSEDKGANMLVVISRLLLYYYLLLHYY